MSLDENGMAGALSANKPITEEMVKSWKRDDLESVPATIYMAWNKNDVGFNNVEVWFWKDKNQDVEVYVSDGEDDTFLPHVNTQGRFLHLLAALGIEVPA